MLTALELGNIIDKINDKISGKGYYVSKIEPLLNDTYLFKLHHSFDDDVLLIISTMGIWLTKNKIKGVQDSYFLATLNRLIRCKLLDIKQFNDDRIIHLRLLDKVDNEDVIFHLIIELFVKNMYLCDSDMRIISMLKQFSSKNRRLEIGLKYTPLTDPRINPLNLSYEDLTPLLHTNNVYEWLVNNIALPRSVIEMILNESNIGNKIDEKNLTLLYNSLIRIRDELRYGNRSLLVNDLKHYLEAIDTMFTNIVLTRIKEDPNKKLLLNHIKIKEQKKQELAMNAAKLREMAERFASNNINEDDLKQIKTLNTDDNIYSIASKLYDKAKKLEKGVRNIEKDIANIRKEIFNIKDIHVSVEEKREWFERYRWFITSDNLLAVGGKDASSNEILLKRYAKDKDIVFHADVHGSPFFILKDAKENSINEVAVAVASFSKAWREGINFIDVYYLYREQLKSSTIKGKFVISGKRNYIKNVELRLGIGVMEYNGKRFLVSAPVESFKGKCIIIKPGYSKGDVIMEIKNRLMHIYNDEFIKNVNVDGIRRILPNTNILIVKESY